MQRVLVVTWLVPLETVAISAYSMCTIQPCTIPRHFIQGSNCTATTTTCTTTTTATIAKHLPLLKEPRAYLHFCSGLGYVVGYVGEPLVPAVHHALDAATLARAHVLQDALLVPLQVVAGWITQEKGSLERTQEKVQHP